jgi:hypothetical protein
MAAFPNPVLTGNGDAKRTWAADPLNPDQRKPLPKHELLCLRQVGDERESLPCRTGMRGLRITEARARLPFWP